MMGKWAGKMRNKKMLVCYFGFLFFLFFKFIAQLVMLHFDVICSVCVFLCLVDGDEVGGFFFFFYNIFKDCVLSLSVLSWRLYLKYKIPDFSI